jgi:hypothetical protein
MQKFKVIYEQDGKRGETLVEHWTKGAALDTFEADHPLATVIEIYED